MIALPLPDAETYAKVTRVAILTAGHMLGLTEGTATRELDRMVQGILPAADELITAIEAENAQFQAEMHGIFAGETRVLRAI